MEQFSYTQPDRSNKALSGEFPVTTQDGGQCLPQLPGEVMEPIFSVGGKTVYLAQREDQVGFYFIIQ